MQLERVNPNDLVVNSMPDGSRVIRNSNNETVFALNATAAAAWDACSYCQHDRRCRGGDASFF